MTPPGTLADGPIAAALGVAHYWDAAEKLARLPMGGVAARAWFARKIDWRAIARSGLLFVHVPKNAGIAIGASTGTLPSFHRSALLYRTLAPRLFAQVEVFAVLRDPFERFISAFWFLRRGGGAEVALDPRYVVGLGDLASPDDLLSFLEAHRHDLFALDHVLRPQAWYVCDHRGAPLVDRLFVLGDDSEDLQRFLEHHRRPPLERRNATVKGGLELSSAQCARIEAFYAQDVELLDSVRRGRWRDAPVSSGA